MLEKEIENKFKKRIKSVDPRVLCLKLVCPGFIGVPDRLVLLPGAHVIFVELKQPGKKERRRQIYVQGLLRNLSFEVYSAVNTMEQIEAIARRCEEVVNRERVCSP